MSDKLQKQMLSALRAALADITETASINLGRYNRATKSYEFNDAMWRQGSPGSFKVAQKIRRAIKAAAPKQPGAT